MPSIWQFISRHKVILESDQVRINDLKQFVAQWDSVSEESHHETSLDNGEEEITESRLPTPKIHESFMFEPLSEYYGSSWCTLGGYEEKRKKLAEERRREYNEYLKEKAKIEAERQRHKKYVQNATMCKLPLPDYSALLERKKLEEKKYRDVNGLSPIEELEFKATKKSLQTLPIAKETKQHQAFSPLISLPLQRNDIESNELILPRNRLLATESSRIRAAEYREELRRQIEEKRRLKHEEDMKRKKEDMDMEKRIEEQRLKMLKEYEEEQERIRKKADELIHRQESSAKHALHGRTLIKPHTSQSIRSPSYLHVRVPRSSDLLGERSETQEAKFYATATKSLTKPEISVIGPSGDYVVRNEEEVPIHSKLAEKVPHKETDNQSEGRILGHLTEVRQMMEYDHKQMLDQLRRQQKYLLDTHHF